MPTDEEEQEIDAEYLAACDRAEWALRMLHAGRHNRLKKFLIGVVGNYRVVSDRGVLNRAQETQDLSEELVRESEPVGIIRGSLTDGQLVLNVVQYDNGADPKGTELLAASQRELRNSVIDTLRQDIGKKPDSNLVAAGSGVNKKPNS